MIQIFDQLDKITDTRFELEKGYLLERYKEMALSEELLTQDEVSRNSIGSIRNLYYGRLLNREQPKIYKYIDDNTSGVANKERLTLFIEQLLNKVGTMRKGFSTRHLDYLDKVRKNPEPEDASYPSLIYASVAWFLDELYNKVEGTYGYLLTREFLKKYELYPPLGDGLLTVFKDARNDQLVKWKASLQKEVYSKPSMKQALQFVLDNIQFIKQQQIIYPDTTENYDTDEWSHYFGSDYKRKLELLQAELETLEKLEKLHTMGNGTGEKIQLHKVHTTLTVKQMSYFLSLLRNDNIVIGPAGTLEQFVTQYFSSGQAEDIKIKSFHNGASSISDKEKEELKDMLMNLWNQIKTNLPKAKKK